VDSYRHVQPGDCVVAFSRDDIFQIKREIEDRTKHKCCIIYGSLPPETRTEQARRFNDPNSGYDVLVASVRLIPTLMTASLSHRYSKKNDIFSP